MHFPEEKCGLLQKMQFSGGHMAGNRRKSQEVFRAQESRTLANFHKTDLGLHAHGWELSRRVFKGRGIHAISHSERFLDFPLHPQERAEKQLSKPLKELRAHLQLGLGMLELHGGMSCFFSFVSLLPVDNKSPST